MEHWDRRAEFFAHAERLKPELKHWIVPAVSIVEPCRDENAWQKTRMQTVAPAAALTERLWGNREHFFLDFGESTVGRIRLTIRPEGKNDSPLRLKLLAAELPYEAAADPDSYRGGLARSWIQDEIINIDVMPCVFTLPRRYSLRYLKIEVVSAPETICFEAVDVIGEAAVEALLPPPAGLPEELAAIDRAAMRTLRNCMQLLMEDGPKRDRRLWLGDLRLQAMANAATFRRFDLIERSLYILAAAADDEGRVPGCAYTEPELRHGNDTCDYALLFAPTLDDLVRESGNPAPAHDLYALAVRQWELVAPMVGEDGLFDYPRAGWVFIDWQTFDRQSPAQAVAIYSLRALVRLAERVGRSADAEKFRAEAERLSLSLRRACYDADRKLILSGPAKEVSVAGQVWPILAGVFTVAEAREILSAMAKEPGVIQPGTPYMQHHLLAAYEFAGMKEELHALLRSYWGGMIRAGADTFWEAYVPGDDFLSPYNDALINSACHAWSCTPSCFLRA